MAYEGTRERMMVRGAGRTVHWPWAAVGGGSGSPRWRP
jgi:hypothetical protein